MDGLSRQHQMIMANLKTLRSSLMRCATQANRVLLTSEKTCGPIAEGLHAIENCRDELGRVADIIHLLTEQTAKLKDECQAFALGVQAGVELVVDMALAEGQYMRGRVSPDSPPELQSLAKKVAHWIDMFADRVRKEKGLIRENKDG